MRILAIRGENLASLEGAFEIDLARGPLAQAGVFAICGATGAGKSTLLDAMCLALFDTAPRLDGRGRSRVGREDGDQLTLTDPRSLLRKGAGAGFAEVEFEGVDGRVYRARWEARRARRKADGNLQPSSMSLVDVAAESRLGDKKTEVKQEVERALGLTFDQFRRSVLLAQGDFAAFLNAEPKERADLLERMTGTEIYGVISMEAHARLTEERRRLEALEGRVDEVRPLSAEERAQLEGQAEGLAHRQAEDRLAAADAAHAVRWHGELAGLRREEREAFEAHRGVERQLALAETKRADLAAVDAALPFAPVLEAVDRARALRARREAQATAAEATAAEAAKRGAEAAAAWVSARAAAEAREAEREAAREDLSKARALDAELVRAEGALEEAVEAARVAAASRAEAEARLAALEEEERGCFLTATAARAALDESEGLAPLASGWERFEPELRALAEEAAGLERVRAAEVAARAALETAAAGAAAHEGRLLGHAARRREALAEWEALRKRVEAEPSAALAEVQAEWSRERTGLETLIGVAARAQSAHDEELRQKRAADDARERAARDARAAERHDAERSAAEARLTEAERARDALRAALDLSARRAELEPGAPCPLCGSEEHPWAERDPVIDAHLAREDERLAELRAARSKAAEAAAEMRSAARAHEESAAAADAEARRWGDTLAALREEYRAAAEGIETADELWPDELPETPVDLAAPDWGPLFELANVTPSGGPLLAEGARAALEEAKREAEAKLAELEREERTRRKRERVAERLRRAFEEARAEEDAARDAHDAARAAAQEAKGAVDDAVHARGRAEERREGRLALLRAPLSALEGWEAELSADPAGLAARVATAVEARRAHEAELARALEAGRALGPSLAAAREHRSAQASRAAERDQERASRAAWLRQRRAARAELLEGRPVLEVEAALAARWEAARDAASKAAAAADQLARAEAERRAEAEQARAARAEAEAEAREAEHRLQAALTSAALAAVEIGTDVAPDEPTLRARLAHDPAEVEGWRRDLAGLDAARAELSAVCAERTRKRQEHEERDPPKLDAAAAERALGAAERRKTETEELLQGVRLRLRRDDEDRERASGLAAELEAQRGQIEVWQTLAELIGSASGNKLRVFAQSLTLELLLEHANHHLRDLAPRYSLARVPGEDLALQVIDHEMGDEVRAASSLSGGESFLVALGLALGLASLSARKTSVGSLFIDEGFGALDPASLEMVLSTLDTLQASGRQVGLISHVPTIAERFDTRVQVVAAGPARSRVEVVVGF